MENMEEVEATATEETVEAQDQEQENENKPVPRYTDEDVNKIVKKRLAKERERLSRMFNEEQQVSELDEREKAILKRELKADAKDRLVDDGLPSSLANLLTYDDEDSFERSYKEVSEIFGEAISRHVAKVLNHGTPKTGAYSKADPLKGAFKL